MKYLKKHFSASQSIFFCEIYFLLLHCQFYYFNCSSIIPSFLFRTCIQKTPSLFVIFNPRPESEILLFSEKFYDFNVVLGLMHRSYLRPQFQFRLYKGQSQRFLAQPNINPKIFQEDMLRLFYTLVHNT